jgi:arylsulfatase A-like enzyme
MSDNRFMIRSLVLSILLMLPVTGLVRAADPAPNIVLIFTDDQGYGDIGCFGAEGYKTPHLDRMAADGMRFTSFYVAQAVCGASRAALLTGCYPNRLGMLGAPSGRSTHGIHDDETLIPEMLKQKGYATAVYGKWHLGYQQRFLPMQHGFDDYFGLPYSNDMWPFHPTAGDRFGPLPLIQQNEVIAHNPDQSKLTTWYTERAVKFIDQNHKRPFFLYLAHSMPHVPLYVSSKYKGHSEQGLYGDVISEIDWSVGQLLTALKRHKIEDRTLVIFTTDNGPWLSYGNHAGSAGPLREGKATAWEGGMRVPCIMRWPGKIPAASRCGEIAATIDVLPTLAEITGCDLPQNKIDGKSIWHLMRRLPAARTPHEAYYYYWGNALHAVRRGPWKLHFPHPYRTLAAGPGSDGSPSKYEQADCQQELYHLEMDLAESRDLASRFPDVVEELTAYADKIRAELGDSLTDTKGSENRPPGRIAKGQ